MSPPTLADAAPRDSDTSGDSAARRRRIQALLSSARQGDRQSIGELLSQYRTYLTLLGAAQFRQRLRPRVSPSDIVQDVMLRAHCNFGQFRGRTEPELLAWLREILLNSLARFVEQHLHAAKRDIRREISLEHFSEAAVDLPRHDLPDMSPAAQRNDLEHAELVAELLDRLPPHYREVLELRNIQGLSFDEVAARLGRSAGATRMLWLRAIEKLRSVHQGRGISESEGT
jgi:RNA polymerase sigma-70 factor (ECF subfamily)